MNAYSTIAADRSTSIIPSLKRTIKSLPVTQQIAIVQFVVEAADFADFDQHALDNLDDALTDCMKQSIYADHAEDRALHGVEVVA
ncbi:hypothetical protein [Sphingomonas sp. UBA978]|uniref:hypothetical protein n=1 Tax=Sphingomonas sp. UBA978 TaxID=1947536 RepID=UPI0025F070B6|nr:hypothetical protein [Sphingomonas sp. UBA978]